MNDVSDSDDSAFLFTTSFSKKKARTNVDQTERTTPNDALQRNEITNLKNEETKYNKEGGNLTDDTNFSVCNSDLIQAESECTVVEDSTSGNENNNQQTSKLLKSKITDYYSCPLCLKTFETEIIHISHMKQCAKKSKMTPKQLLQALEMHKDQLKRRLHSGLSSPMKKRRKTRNQDSLESSYELSLGLALSKSLSEVNQNHLGSHNLSGKSNKTTLENFGFTSSNCNFGGAGRRKLKNWKNIQFALRERTKEQRERLVTEKAAVILLCKDYEYKYYKKPEQEGLCDVVNIQEREKKESLWKLGEIEDNVNWYVENIKSFMVDERGEDVNEENTQNSEECEIDGEIKSLNLPRMSVFQDWKKLVNNPYLSDLNFRSKSAETFHLHSVVLYVRCPTMLDLNLDSVLGGFNTLTILSFLQYLYCGVLDGLKRPEIENLLHLARLVNFEELCQVLNMLIENLNLKRSEREEIALELDATLHQKEENIGNNRDVNPNSENTSYREEELKIHSRISDANSNNSLQEIIRENCDDEDAKNECDQNLFKRSESNVDAFWKPNKTENRVNHMEIEERIHVSLNGEDEKLPSSIDKTLTHDDELSNRRGDTENLEKDMFEEEDPLNRINNVTDNFNISPPRHEDNTNEYILVSSGSSRGGLSNDDRLEEFNGQNEEFPISDCEIPYFDPYEYFNSEILIPDSPILSEDHTLRSQSLFHNEISRVKLPSPGIGNLPCDKGSDSLELKTNSPTAKPSTNQVSGFCSTPITRLDKSPQLSNRDKSSTKYLKRGQRQKSLSLRYKRSRSVIASRLMKSKLLRSSSVKKKRNTSKYVKNDEDKEADILTESILKDLDNSFGIGPGKSPETQGRKFIEVTPAATGEEFSEEVSPLPDYSTMDVSGIKKHLAKYGLKKSLSKNKAKKILRHIYEELHPLINTRNGKIIKYEPVEKRKQSKTKSDKKKKKNLNDKKLKVAKDKSVNEGGARKTPCKNPDEDISDNHSSVTRSEAEDTKSPFDSTNSSKRSEENIFEGSDSEIQESQSQSNFSSAKDVTEAVVDFIYSNREIHRRILMYEPIWLEKFRQQLYEKYNKKYKVTDLMDCLDAEVVCRIEIDVSDKFFTSLIGSLDPLRPKYIFS